MSPTWKRIVWSVAGLGVAAVVVVSFLPTPVPVETARVTTGAMRVILEADGITRVRDRFVISTPVAGKLSRIDLREGDAVTPGMALASIQPVPVDQVQRQELERRIDAARAALEMARAGRERSALMLADAERELARMRGLIEVGAVPRQQIEQAESAVRAAGRDLDAAGYRVRGATSDLAQVEAGRGAYQGSAARAVVLRAPAAGRILRLFETSERVIPAGTPLMQVGDPRGTEVVIDLLSSDAVPVRAGDRLIVDGWGGERPLDGAVRYVEPSAYTKVSALGVEEQRVNAVGVLADHPAELGDGYRVRAGIVRWEGRSVLKIPVSALFRSDGAWSAFLVADGRARRVPVTIGHRSALEAEVLSGLKEGQSVIVHPSDQLTDGARVDTESPVQEQR